MLTTISNDCLEVQINSLGAELQSIKGNHGTEYLWQGEKEYWEDRAPNLFPYIARLTNGKYLYKKKEYNMPIHGFLPYTDLVLEKQEETSAVFRLLPTEKTRIMYPFEFDFRAGYELEGNRLKIKYQVINRDIKTMYFGVGGHPGFNVPLGEGEFEDYYLEFAESSQPYRIGMSADCFVNGQDIPYRLREGKYLSLTHDMFDDDAIILRGMASKISLKSLHGEHMVSVEYPQMKYLGIWHAPQTKAKYICIEPWTSLPSRKGIVENLEQQKDLIVLPAGRLYENQWSISFF